MEFLPRNNALLTEHCGVGAADCGVLRAGLRKFRIAGREASQVVHGIGGRLREV
jgi:hypothetical protein